MARYGRHNLDTVRVAKKRQPRNYWRTTCSTEELAQAHQLIAARKAV